MGHIGVRVEAQRPFGKLLQALDKVLWFGPEWQLQRFESYCIKGIFWSSAEKHGELDTGRGGKEKTHR